MTIAGFLASSPVLLLALAFILGLIVGSFLNVVIYRLPLMMERDWRAQCHEFLELPAPVSEGFASGKFNLSQPGSHCPHCKHAIGASENIPVISYILQRGKCIHCNSPISPRYPILETVTGLFSLLTVASFGLSWLTLALLIFTWTLIVLTMIDLDRQLLPDDITLPLLWLGLLVNSQGLLTSLQNAVWGEVAGYLILWSIYWIFKLLTGKEGMGYGDFKLLAALGAWLGWQALPQIILLSSLVGVIVGVSMIVLKGRDKNIPIPFGPYLASAGFIALLWGDKLSALVFNSMV